MSKHDRYLDAKIAQDEIERLQREVNAALADATKLRARLERRHERIAELEAAIHRVCAGDASGPGLARLYALVSDES